MKIIERAHSHLTLDAVIALARENLVVLREADGSMFALTQVDDFDFEVELLKNNPEFMAFLKQAGQDEETISIEDLRKELGV